MKKDTSQTIKNHYTENIQKSSFFKHIENINKSFFYAEKVLTISAIILFIGSLFFIFSHYYGYETLSPIGIFTTGLLTVNLFFLLFLGITMFALGHKLRIDYILFKEHKIPSPMMISIGTLFVILLSFMFNPIITCFIILLSSLSVGFRINSDKFIDILTQVTSKTTNNIEPNLS